MFELSNNAFLPELEVFLEVSRAKNCRKFSFRKKMRNIEPVCLEQNTIRSILKRALPIETKHVEDNHFGVDYEYKGITLDQKFSFGALGKNTIKIRVTNRSLLNSSDWTMVINKNWELELFQTKKLSQFVRKNWGLVQKRIVERKSDYTAYAVRLDDLYRIENVIPLITTINNENISVLFEQALIESNQTLVEETINSDCTILNKKKQLCFEPALAILAKQLLGKS